MNDPISDLIIRLKNACITQKEQVVLPYSKFKQSILEILKENDYIEKINTKKENQKQFIKVTIGNKNLNHLKQISKPGRRCYVRCHEIPRPIRGLGLVIVSTPAGVLSGAEARKKGAGGEVICEVW